MQVGRPLVVLVYTRSTTKAVTVFGAALSYLEAALTRHAGQEQGPSSPGLDRAEADRRLIRARRESVHA